MTSRIKLKNIEPSKEIENLLSLGIKRNMQLRKQQTKSTDLFNDLGINRIG